MSEAYLLLFDKYSNSSLVVDTLMRVCFRIRWIFYLPTYLTRYMYLIFFFSAHQHEVSYLIISFQFLPYEADRE